MSQENSALLAFVQKTVPKGTPHTTPIEKKSSDTVTVEGKVYPSDKVSWASRGGKHYPYVESGTRPIGYTKEPKGREESVMSQKKLNEMIAQTMHGPKARGVTGLPKMSRTGQMPRIGMSGRARMTHQQRMQRIYNAARKTPSFHLDPNTGLRTGKGVHRTPGEFEDTARYIAGRAVGEGLLGGLRSLLGGTVNLADEKLQEKVNLWRLPPELRAKAKARIEAKKFNDEKMRQQLRASGVRTPETESTTERLMRHTAYGAMTGSAVAAASGLNEVMARNPALYPIEFRVNPDKFNRTLEYYHRRMKGKTFSTLAQAQMDYNKIADGIASGDPDYDNPSGYEALSRLRGIITDGEKYGEKKFGRGWLRNKAEQEKQALAHMEALGKQVYIAEKAKGIELGVDDPRSYALKRTHQMLGIHPLARKAIANVYRSYETLDERNPTIIVSNKEKHERDFKDRVRDAEAKLGVRKPKTTQAPITVPPKPADTREDYTRLTPEQQAERIARERSQTTGGNVGGHLAANPKFYRGLAYTKSENWRRSLKSYIGSPHADDQKKAAQMIHRAWPDLKGTDIRQVILDQKSKMTTNKMIAGPDMRKVNDLRDFIGRLQSHRVILKNITSAPVEGALLVRQDLQGGHRRRYRRSRR